MLSKLFGGSSGESIDVAEAQRRVTAGEVELVDVREKDEWKSGYAPLAKHIPLGSLSAQLEGLAGKGIEQGRKEENSSGSQSQEQRGSITRLQAISDRSDQKFGLGAPPKLMRRRTMITLSSKMMPHWRAW